MSKKAPTEEDFDRALQDTFPLHVHADTEMVDRWVVKNGGEWPEEVAELRSALEEKIRRLYSMLKARKPDAVLASYHQELWAQVNKIKRSLDRLEFVERGRQGANQRHGAKPVRDLKHISRASRVRQYREAGGSQEAAVNTVAKEDGVLDRQIYRSLRLAKTAVPRG